MKVFLLFPTGWQVCFRVTLVPFLFSRGWGTCSVPNALRAARCCTTQERVARGAVGMTECVLRVCLRTRAFFLRLYEVADRLLATDQVSPLLGTRYVRRTACREEGVLCPDPLQLPLVPRQTVPRNYRLPPPTHRTRRTCQGKLLRGRRPRAPYRHREKVPLLPLRSRNTLHRELRRRTRRPALRRTKGHRHRPSDQLQPARLLPHPREQAPTTPQETAVHARHLRASKYQRNCEV